MSREDVDALLTVALPQLSSADGGVTWQAGPTPTVELWRTVDRLQSSVTSIAKAANTSDDDARRAWKAYFRSAAWMALLANPLTEREKAWVVKNLKQKEKPALALEGWASSEDPHAGLVRQLRAKWPAASPQEVAQLIAALCEGWCLQTPGDEEDYESPTPRQQRSALLKLANANPACVEAVEAWLAELPGTELHRRVLHAGTLLAAAGRARSLSALLDDVEKNHGAPAREWASQVFAGFKTSAPKPTQRKPVAAASSKPKRKK